MNSGPGYRHTSHVSVHCSFVMAMDERGGEMMGDETFGFYGNIPEEKGRVNPMVRLFGLGPEGEICKNCAHLIGHSYSHTYYKCNLRTITSGPSSDHRVRWSACAKFKKRK